MVGWFVGREGGVGRKVGRLVDSHVGRQEREQEGRQVRNKLGRRVGALEGKLVTCHLGRFHLIFYCYQHAANKNTNTTTSDLEHYPGGGKAPSNRNKGIACNT